MAQSNVLKRYLDAGLSFTEMTQAKAEALVKDLVRVGEIQTEQAQEAISELIERSKANTEAFILQLRSEIAENAESLGLATIADLNKAELRIEERLEKFLAAVRPDATAKKAPAKKKAAAKKTTAKKTAVKKTTAKKTTAKKTTAKKTTAKKTTAKKTAAKKAPAKKTTAKKTAAKKAAPRSTAS